MIALLGIEAEVQADLWTTLWFPAFFAVSAICMVGGGYVLLSAYVDLPMLRTLEERRAGLLRGQDADAEPKPDASPGRDQSVDRPVEAAPTHKGPERPQSSTPEPSGGFPTWAALLGLAAVASDAELRPKLKEQRQHGRALLERSTLVFGPTEEDLLGWEAEVEYILRDDAKKLALFRSDTDAATAPLVLGPDWRRMRKSLTN